MKDPLLGLRPGYLILLAALSALSCGGRQQDTGSDTAPTPPPQVPAECVSNWSDAETAELVDRLVGATQPGSPVWVDYGLEDGAYVVYAGESNEGGSCLGVWRAGVTLGYSVLATKPKLLTLLYGYHLPEGGSVGSFEEVVTRGRQPPEIRGWLAEIGVESAVIIPNRVEGLPFKISPLQLAQTAIHEGFHIIVQMPRWRGFGGDWPEWDRQPDRPAVRGCYTANAAVESAFQKERATLVEVVEALLDGDQEVACRAGSKFLQQRAERYQLLTNTQVADHEGRPISCTVAETIMELEEGTADYASWSKLFQLGQASRETLLRRYQAQQAEAFYLTGAMQLHALSLMRPEAFLQLTEEIAASLTLQEGSITTVFGRGLQRYCM